MELTPDERQRIFLEERVRNEAQEALRQEAEAAEKQKAQEQAKQAAVKQQRGCVGCLGFFVILLLIVFGQSNPLGAMLTILVGGAGILLASLNGGAFSKYGNPKAARSATIAVSALVLALGVYGIYWQNSAEGKAQFERVERRSKQIKETEDLPRDVQKDIDDEYHRSGDSSRRR
jgi:F0F1-type ATP synthase assembly protein I